MLEKSNPAVGPGWVAPTKPVRKNRSVEEKRKIVLESLSSEASIAAVARTDPRWPVKFPHLWPGQTPPPERAVN